MDYKSVNSVASPKILENIVLIANLPLKLENNTINQQINMFSALNMHFTTEKA